MAVSAKPTRQTKSGIKPALRSIQSGASSPRAEMVSVEVLRDGFYGGIFYKKGQTISMVSQTARQFLPPYGNQLKKT